MPIKYTAQPSISTFESEGTSLTFSTPTEKEILAYGGLVSNKVTGAVDAEGKIVASKLTPEQWAFLYQSDEEFLAARLQEITGLEDEQGAPVDTSVWTQADRVRFLAWLDLHDPLFRDFRQKLVSGQKKTA